MTISAQSFNQQIQLNINPFGKDLSQLHQQKSYNGQINRNGDIHEKFSVLGKLAIDEREYAF